MALTTRDVLRLIELLQQNEWLREELRRILFPPNFDTWMKGVDERLMRIESAIGELRGSAKESEYRQRAPLIFGSLLTQIHNGQEEVAERLRVAVTQGLISTEEATELRRTDLLLMGKLWKGKWAGREILLVVELSVTISREDVERALKRADIARKLGFWAIPCVGGEKWSRPAVKQWALSESVLCYENGVLKPSPDTDWETVEKLLVVWKPIGR
ncbi:MAG: hypothetical protein ACK4I8_09300 [Armatimonadota bacterium]